MSATRNYRSNHFALGGTMLRQLREEQHFSLMDVEQESSGGVGYAQLQRIETGRIARPSSETITTILDTYGASYRVRCEVLEAYGYSPPTPLPSPAEIAAARRQVAQDFAMATFPVYLIDCAQRLQAWNRYMPRLIGCAPEDPALNEFVGRTIFDLAFNPQLKTRFLIDNPDEFLPALIIHLKSELWPFRTEGWYATLLRTISAQPELKALWDRADPAALAALGSHIPVPLRLDVPGAGLLTFSFAGSSLISDPRFLVVHYTPIGAVTLRQCADWAEAEGAL